MLNASSTARFAAALVACALAVLFAPLAPAQTINLSLNVFYSNPASTSSGGTWELVAKSSDYGIVGLDVRLTNIASGPPQNKAPRGIVNGANVAGFQLFDSPQPSFHEFVLGQIPISNKPASDEQSAIYGIGTLINGAPDYPSKPPGTNSIGPVFSSFTNPQNIPWATGDFFFDPAWNTAARMAGGTFAAGVTPAFFAGSSGNVFTTIGTSDVYGLSHLATTLTTTVRTNFADYNRNGVVDAADYVLWRKTLGTLVPNGTAADGNGDGVINQPDYNLWRRYFGFAFPATAPSLFANEVPEPASCLLLAMGFMLAVGSRRPRAPRTVNN